MAIGFEVKRQNRIAGRFGQPHRTRLGDARRAARPVEREPGGAAGAHVARQLPQRLARPVRGRSARGTVAESFDDPGNPLAVEVLAGDHDDAAASEIVGRRQNASVPERHDRTAAARGNLLEVFEPFGAPAKRGPERRDQTVSGDGDGRRLEAFQRRGAPGTSPFR